MADCLSNQPLKIRRPDGWMNCQFTARPHWLAGAEGFDAATKLNPSERGITGHSLKALDYLYLVCEQRRPSKAWRNHFPEGRRPQLSMITQKAPFISSPLHGALVLGAMVLSLVFSGCASVPRVDPDKAALQSVRSIALLRVQEPRAVEVANIGGTAGAFGMIGGIVQAVNNGNRTEEFVSALRQRNQSLAEPLTIKLRDLLQEAGYQVNVSDQQPKPSTDKKSDDFSAITVTEDLILLVWIGRTGYISEPYSLSYEPWVFLTVRALDARTKRDVYWKSFTVGYNMKIKQAVNIPADARYRFKSHPEIMQRLDEAITGLIESHNLAAQAIVADLNR